jgi:hypothetical protein
MKLESAHLGCTRSLSGTWLGMTVIFKEAKARFSSSTVTLVVLSATRLGPEIGRGWSHIGVFADNIGVITNEAFRIPSAATRMVGTSEECSWL